MALGVAAFWWNSSVNATPPARTFAPTFDVGNMTIMLELPAQTIASLTVAASDLPTGSFDFMPDPATFRGSHRLGDVSMRLRAAGSSDSFVTLTTGGVSAAKAAPLPTLPGELAAADLSATLDAPPTLSLRLERHYTRAADGHGLKIRFGLTNLGSMPLEVGAWGAAMIFDTMATQGGGQRSLNDFAGNCSMVDPAIAGEGGWVSATRMTGTGGVLLIVPEGGAGVQAWRLMREASGGESFELMSLSKAYNDSEWADAKGPQWLTPTSRVLAPGEDTNFTYRLLLAPSVRDKDKALAAAGFPVVQAVPGWTIGTDMRSAALHVLPPAGARILHVSVEPEGSMDVAPPQPIGSGGFFTLGIRGIVRGRARARVAFTDGTAHVSNFHVLPPFSEQLSLYGKFASEVAWYSNTSDPFARGNSVLAWNRELKLHIGVPPEQVGSAPAPLRPRRPSAPAAPTPALTPVLAPILERA